MRHVLLTLLALVLVPVTSSAQARKDNWENLKQLQPGHKVKVVDMSLKSWDGRLVNVSDESITIRETREQQEISVERTKVFRVTDLQRSRRGRNALIGLLAGGLVFAAATAKEGGDDAEKALFIGLFGGMGAAAGAAIPYPRPTIYSVRQKPH